MTSRTGGPRRQCKQRDSLPAVVQFRKLDAPLGAVSSRYSLICAM
jgi:hypothetical protein